ncbi:bifunctional 5,10-methylenetetrahydrofolate dehydrogenase/5,10-methenyltetrahydrofolate cyclohydrolase [Candidatus Daviesbacteria bacterium]|nr:bifunctional 5,10-methylenetetrahydrofolate dehydrogenase/5,10-methenyltetrahydrofolate cyclohydrolase [Candidatus Daviesbacteria bacterium]
MKVSGRVAAEAILKKLEKEIKEKNLHPSLAIILAGNDSSSRIYIKNKIKSAERIGIIAKLFEFSESQLEKCIETIKKLNEDSLISGIIIQYPVYPSWNFDELEQAINPQKDVDGFREDSPYAGATALAVWEMLTAFSLIEGFKRVEDFLKGKKIVLIGKGKAAGGPIFKLLTQKGFTPEVIVKETENPTPIIKSGDLIISATGAKNIINKTNLKPGAYVVGIGTGDLNEEEVCKIAKLYNPNIGGIGPLTIVSLLKNVVKASENKL